jgi:hypothetical protein
VKQIASDVGSGQIGVKDPIERNADGFTAVILSARFLIVEFVPHRFNLGMLPSHRILHPGLLANGGPPPLARVFVESRGRRRIPAGPGRVSQLLCLSGLEHSHL